MNNRFLQEQYQDAVYKNPPEARFHANRPEILALPKLIMPQEYHEAFRTQIDFKKEDRLAPNYIRKAYYLDQLLFWRITTNNQIRLYEQFVATLTTGYLGRASMLSKNFIQSVKNGRLYIKEAKIGEPQNQPRRIQSVPTSIGFVVIGHSGTGKSSGVVAVTNVFPQVIRHKYFLGPFDRDQIVYLYLICPANGADVKSICEQAILQIDELLGSHYYTLYNAGSNQTSANDLVQALYTLSMLHGIGAIFIDEIQNLQEVKEGNINVLIGFFMDMNNRLAIPIIPVGTPAAAKLIVKALGHVRRVSGRGDIFYKPMEEYDNNGVLNSEWKLFTDQLWKFQYVQKVKKLEDNEAIRTALYYCSQGIHDLVVKVFTLAQIRAIDTGMEEITADIIYSVTDRLQLLQPILQAIRSGDKEKMSEYDDIHNEIMEEIERAQYLQHEVEFISPADTPTYSENNSHYTQTEPSETDISEDADNKAEEVPQTKPTTSNKRTLKKINRVKKVAKDGLLAALNVGLEEKFTPYEALRQAGFVKPIKEFFE